MSVMARCVACGHVCEWDEIPNGRSPHFDEPLRYCEACEAVDDFEDYKSAEQLAEDTACAADDAYDRARDDALTGDTNDRS